MFRRRRRSEADFAAEIEAHLRLEADRLREDGLSAEEAEAAARRAFGNVTSARERFYEAGRWLLWDHLRQDLRFAVRLLARSPLLTATVVLTLALGIGANSLVFSVVHAVVFRPLPFPEADRLVQLWETGLRGGGDADWVAFPNFRDWRASARHFDEMAAYRFAPMTMTGPPATESLLGLEATDRLFAVLRVEPLLGRTLLPGEDGAGRERVAVISHRLWERRFARDPQAVGRAVTLDGQPYTVVGVMPAEFRFPNKLPAEVGIIPVDVWIPMRPGGDLEDRNSHNFWVVARLKPGVAVAEARAAMSAIGETLAREHPGSNAGMGVAVEPLHQYVSGRVQPALLSLLGAVTLVLLLACANVANLLLSRAESRRREIAIRQSLGAARGRLIRQTLTESLLLALVGAVAGLGLAAAGNRLVLRFGPPNIPRLQDASIDGAVVLFTATVAVVVGVLFGMVPAFVSARGDLRGALQQAGMRTSTGSSLAVRHMLVGAQMALAVMLLVGAGLLIRSFVRVALLDPGFHPARVLTGILVLPPSRYSDPQQQLRFYDALLRGLNAMPEVESAALSNSVPLTGINDQGGVAVEGAAARAPGEEERWANRPRVSAGYFATMGIPLVEGRVFDERDRTESPAVAVVSDRAAREWWPGRSALGRRVAVTVADGGWVWREVVGVVRATRHFGLEAPGHPEVYVLYTQDPAPFMSLVVRTRTDPAAVVPAIGRTIAQVDPEQAAIGVQAMDDVLSTAGARRRFVTSLSASFAGLALLLAALGVYGVIAYTVATRTREIGVRLALGGRPSAVATAVLRQAMRVSLLGTAVGVAGAAALSRLLGGLLFGVPALDPASFTAAAALLLAAGLAAAWIPGRGATRINPMVALRDD